MKGIRKDIEREGEIRERKRGRGIERGRERDREVKGIEGERDSGVKSAQRTVIL